MIKKILLVLISLALLAGAAGLVFIWQVGAWNILFPSSHHDSTPPDLSLTADYPTLLIFSKTNQFRHKDGIAGGLKALTEIGEALEMQVIATENGAVFQTATLEQIDVVVFLNATGDMLSAAQESAFKAWLQGGGGWLGIHAAGDGSHAGWPWYVENLIGANFTAHIMGPQFQTATVITEDQAHTLSQEIPASWQAEEEWYSWDASPREKGFHVIAAVDEASYTPVQDLFGNKRDLAMGDHPVTWTNCIGAGRSFYTALGHAGAAFEHPHFRRQLENAVRWLNGENDCLAK